MTDILLSGTMTTCMAAVIGFFVRKWIKDTDNSVMQLKAEFNNFKEKSESSTDEAISKVINDFTRITGNLQNITEGMNKNISSMEKLIAVLEATVKNQYEATTKELRVINERVKGTEDELNRQGKTIARIEASCNVQHKRTKRE